MTIETLLSFAVVAMLMVMSPGPNGLLIARTVPSRGRLAGFANVAGFATAFYVHGTLAIFGLSVILVQSAQAFLAVKIAGALYLCFIGLKSLREALRARSPVVEAPEGVPRRARRLRAAVAEGFLTNVLNPKVALFYLAIFPQFMGLQGDPVATGYALTTVHALCNLVWFAGIILVLGPLAGLVRSDLVARLMKGATGLVFLGFGWRLATYRP